MTIRQGLLVGLIAGSLLAPGTAAASDVCAVLPLAAPAGPPAAGLTVWTELDRELLVCGPAAAVRSAIAGEEPLVAPRPVDPDRLRAVAGFARPELEALGARPLASGGRWRVVELPPRTELAAPDHHHAVLPVAGTTTLARQVPAALERTLASDAASLADDVDVQRWWSDVVTLAGWSRSTYGAEIHQARDWLAVQLDALHGVTAATAAFTVGSTPAYNVIGRLEGAARPDDLVIVGGHYDATCSRTGGSCRAPGAEDNASGCAGVLEMARVLSMRPPDATVLFVCWSGEEQGLYGSYDHSGDLVAAGLDGDVVAVLDLDMISTTSDDDLDILLETYQAHAWLRDVMVAASPAAPGARLVTSWNPFGSDHMPYLYAGIPAILAITNDYAAYADYHTSDDVPANLSLPMAEAVLRLHAAALGELAGSPGVMVFRDGFEAGGLGQWTTGDTPPVP